MYILDAHGAGHRRPLLSIMYFCAWSLVCAYQYGTLAELVRHIDSLHSSWPSLAQVGAKLAQVEPSWSQVGPSWTKLGQVRTIWAKLGPCLDQVRASSGQLGPTGPTWGKLAQTCGQLGAKLGPKWDPNRSSNRFQLGHAFDVVFEALLDPLGAVYVRLLERGEGHFWPTLQWF